MRDIFFAGHHQENVDIRGVPGKAPMFFREVHMMSAVFTADLAALSRALPPQLGRKPIPVWPGRGLAAIACFEYQGTDIGAYNEVALSIPIIANPGLAALPELLRGLGGREVHAFIKELPVTTETALYGGLDFFNYPKYLADITFSETDTTRTCMLRERKTGSLILEFTGQKLATHPAERSDVATANTYPIFKGRRVHARLLMNRQQSATSLSTEAAAIRIGEGPHAEPFRELNLGRLLQYVYAPKNQAILFKPE